MYPIRFVEFMIKRNVQHMILHVTARCNLECKHCFVDLTVKDELKIDEYKRLAEETGKLFWLDIGGGEPFLRVDLPEIASAFMADIITIPTNGWYTDRIVSSLKLLRDLTSAELCLSISIDGLKNTHGSIRNDEEGWGRAWRTFHKVRELKGISLKINTVLSKANAGELLELMRYVREQDPDFHSVILLRGTPKDPEFTLPSIEELRVLAPEILKIQASYDYGKSPLVSYLLRNYNRYLWVVSLETLKKKMQVISCLAGRAHMVVYANGDVSSCELLPVIGNVKEKSLRGIMKSDEFLNQKQHIIDKKCYCTHNCAMLDSILLNPRHLPHLLYRSKGI